MGMCLKSFVAYLLLIALAAARTQQPLGPSLENGNIRFPSLLDATLDELSKGLESGSFTSVDLVKAYLARIEEINPVLHAVTEINPKVISIAQDLDFARQNGDLLGPLHGIPLLLKNNIATDDEMNTTAGSYALLGAKVPEDSTVVARLRKAGAIILGKSNLSQWSDARSFNSSNGWSSHGGQTKGAYHADQDPCGSSSGSGVASSVGLAWASLGTETAGSIQCPSSWNNVVGIKPTVGLTSRYLVIPCSEHQDTVGPIARTTKDAAHLLTAIVGKDKNDNYTSAIPFGHDNMPDYVGACKTSALRGKRIGVPRHLMDLSLMPNGTIEHMLATFESSLAVMRSAGAEVVDDIFLPGWQPVNERRYMRRLVDADLLADLPKYFSKLVINPNNITSLADVQKFSTEFPTEEFPERDTGVFDGAIESNYDSESYEIWSNRTEALHLVGHLGITGALLNHSLDALVLPSYFTNSPPALLGSPAVTVPMGSYPVGTPVSKDGFGDLNMVGSNIPFGISFLGAHFSEEVLIGIAYAFEQRTMMRTKVKPIILPKTELADVVSSRSNMKDMLDL